MKRSAYKITEYGRIVLVFPTTLHIFCIHFSFLCVITHYILIYLIIMLIFIKFLLCKHSERTPKISYKICYFKKLISYFMKLFSNNFPKNVQNLIKQTKRVKREHTIFRHFGLLFLCTCLHTIFPLDKIPTLRKYVHLFRRKCASILGKKKTISFNNVAILFI